MRTAVPACAALIAASAIGCASDPSTVRQSAAPKEAGVGSGGSPVGTGGRDGGAGASVASGGPRNPTGGSGGAAASTGGSGGAATSTGGRGSDPEGGAGGKPVSALDCSELRDAWSAFIDSHNDCSVDS